MVFSTSWPVLQTQLLHVTSNTEGSSWDGHTPGTVLISLPHVLCLTLFPGIWEDSEATRTVNPWNEVPHVKWDCCPSAGFRSTSTGKIQDQNLPWCLCAALVSKLWVLYPDCNIMTGSMTAIRLFFCCLEWPPMPTTTTFSWLLSWRTMQYTSKERLGVENHPCQTAGKWWRVWSVGLKIISGLTQDGNSWWNKAEPMGKIFNSCYMPVGKNWSVSLFRSPLSPWLIYQPRGK